MLHTFKAEMRSAACKSVRPEMSSTILVIRGSEVAGGGGGAEAEATSGAVASHLLDEPARDLKSASLSWNWSKADGPGLRTGLMGVCEMLRAEQMSTDSEKKREKR